MITISQVFCFGILLWVDSFEVLGKPYNEIRCSKKSLTTFSTKKKTFALVLDTTAGNADAVREVTSNIHEIVKEFRLNETQLFSTFVLNTFDDKNRPSTLYFDSVDQFTKTVNESGFITSESETCTAEIYGNAYTVMSTPGFAEPGSVVFIIAHGKPSWAMANEFTDRLRETKAQVYLMLSIKGCKFTYDYLEIREIARRLTTNSGNVYVFEKGNLVKKMKGILKGVMNRQVIHAPYMLAYNRTNQEFTTYVDSWTTHLTVSVFGQYAAVGVINPSGDVVGATDVFQGGFGSLAYVHLQEGRNKAGKYKVVVSAPGKNWVEVAMSGRSFVWVGFVGGENITEDVTQTSPLKGKNRIVAHLGIGMERYVGEVTLAYLIDEYTRKLTVLPFMKRVGCAYDHISKPFKCDHGSPFRLLIFGTDSNGIPFRRHLGTFKCPY